MNRCDVVAGEPNSSASRSEPISTRVAWRGSVRLVSLCHRHQMQINSRTQLGVFLGQWRRGFSVCWGRGVGGALTLQHVLKMNRPYAHIYSPRFTHTAEYFHTILPPPSRVSWLAQLSLFITAPVSPPLPLAPPTEIVGSDGFSCERP